jgi:hypothetical protein
MRRDILEAIVDAVASPGATGSDFRIMRLAGRWREVDVAAVMGVSARWVSYLEAGGPLTKKQADRYRAAFVKLLHDNHHQPDAKLAKLTGTRQS